MSGATHYDPLTGQYWKLLDNGALFVWVGHWRCWNSEGFHTKSQETVSKFEKINT